MKSIFVTMFSLFMALNIAGCDKESIIEQTDLPSEIASYIETHFPGQEVVKAIEERDGFTKTYEVILEGDVNLEFNRKKEIIEIDGSSKLPDSVIPEKILQYVAANYPDNVITDWELDDKNQQVGLDNDIDLEFNMNGEFLRIDD